MVVVVLGASIIVVDRVLTTASFRIAGHDDVVVDRRHRNVDPGLACAGVTRQVRLSVPAVDWAVV